jgi:hypothetical protein
MGHDQEGEGRVADGSSGLIMHLSSHTCLVHQCWKEARREKTYAAMIKEQRLTYLLEHELLWHSSDI